jgi:hypothetical protein
MKGEYPESVTKPEEPQDLEALKRLLGGSEPAELGGYLTVPQEGRVLFEGTSVPIIAQAMGTPIQGSPLVVPLSARLGSAPIDYTGAYVTVDEYLDLEHMGVPLDWHRMARVLAGEHPLEEMLARLALLMHLLDQPELLNRVTQEYIQSWSPQVQARLNSALSGSRGTPFVFLGRQPVLAALRFLLTEEPLPRESSDPYPSWLAAILLTHVIAKTLLGEQEEETGELLAGEPAHLFLEVVRVTPFGETIDFFSSLNRVARLWRDYGARLTRSRLKDDPLTLLTRATGLELEELLGLAFAILQRRINGLGNETIFDAPNLRVELPKDKIDAFLDLVAVTPIEVGSALADTNPRFGFVPIEQHPVLITDRGLLLVDERALWARVTTGLYWVVHDYLRDAEGDRSRELWNQAHSEMVELLVEDALRAMAPPVFGHVGANFYTEEDFGRAYPGRKRADVAVDFGRGMVMTEVVAGNLTIGSRVEGDVGQFRRDVEKLVIKKYRQLNECSLAVLEDPSRLTGYSPPEPYRIVPVVVIGGQFPVNPMTVRYVHETLAEEGLLQDPRVGSVCVIDLEELELLEGLCERGNSILDILNEWRESGLANAPLKTFAAARFGRLGPDSRPKRMKAEVHETITKVVVALGMTPKQDS